MMEHILCCTILEQFMKKIDEGFFMNLNRSLRTPPLILFEDVSIIERSREDGLISSTGLLRIEDSTLRQSDLESISCLESFSLAHSICSMGYSDGFYSIKSISYAIKDTNTALERRRNLKSIYLDSDGLDVSIFDDKKIKLNSEDSIHTSLQPFSKVITDIENYSTIYNGLSLMICFIQPNQEIINFKGFKAGVNITDEQKRKHLKFNSLIIGERNLKQKEFACRKDFKSNPKTFLLNNLNSKSYDKFLNKVVEEMSINPYLCSSKTDLGEVSNLLNLENENIRFSVYFAKNNRSRPDRTKFNSFEQYNQAKSDWWKTQHQTMNQLLKVRSNSEIYDLFNSDYLYVPVKFEINTNSISISIDKKQPNQIARVNYALERILAK